MRNYLDQLDKKLAKELIKKGNLRRKKGLWLWVIVVLLLCLVTAGVFLVSPVLFPLQPLTFSEKVRGQKSGQTKYDDSQKIASVQHASAHTAWGSPGGRLPLMGEFFSQGLPDEFTLLFLGVPGGDHKAPYLTDSIILFYYQKPRLFFFSLPRDLLVRVPGQDYYTKLNALYVLDRQIQKEPSLIVQKIQELSGLPIDFYVVVDLELVKKIINILDGINISVTQDIYDPRFPGPNNSYQTFELKAGWRYLDGETALKYIRTRSSPGGDFDRMDRQQQLLLVAKRKVSGLNPLTSLPELIKIYQNLKEHIITNLNIRQILSSGKLFEKLEQGDVARFVINRESGLLQNGRALFGDEEAYVLLPTAGRDNYEEIREFIKEKLNQ